MSTPNAQETIADRAHPFRVEWDDGSYFISFPDLPGCMTQVDDVAEIGKAAEEIRLLWLETARERGMAIPPPSAPMTHSGKFVVRVPRTLHRELAESAAKEGVSLNQYVATLLARGDAFARVERRLTDVERRAGFSPELEKGEVKKDRHRRAGLSLVGEPKP